MVLPDPHDRYEMGQRRRWATLLRGFVIGLIIVGGGYFAYLAAWGLH